MSRPPRSRPRRLLGCVSKSCHVRTCPRRPGSVALWSQATASIDRAASLVSPGACSAGSQSAREGDPASAQDRGAARQQHRHRGRAGSLSPPLLGVEWRCSSASRYSSSALACRLRRPGGRDRRVTAHRQKRESRQPSQQGDGDRDAEGDEVAKCRSGRECERVVGNSLALRLRARGRRCRELQLPSERCLQLHRVVLPSLGKVEEHLDAPIESSPLLGVIARNGLGLAVVGGSNASRQAGIVIPDHLRHPLCPSKGEISIRLIIPYRIGMPDDEQAHSLIVAQLPDRPPNHDIVVTRVGLMLPGFEVNIGRRWRAVHARDGGDERADE